MVVAEISFGGLIVGSGDTVTGVFDFIIVFFIVLEGRIAEHYASVHSKTVGLVRAKAMLVSPEPAAHLRKYIEQLPS
jgi:hypothetical protein